MASENEKKIIWIIGIIVLALLFYKYSDSFSIMLSSPMVQYYNQPISATFSLSNYTNPIISGYFNDVELFEMPANTTNWTQNLVFEKSIANGTYTLKLSNVTSEGVFKFKATEGNFTETQLIEVKQPFVDIKHNIPSTIDKGSSLNMQIMTFTPQGDILDADSIDIDIYDPQNVKTTIFMEKSGNFTKVFNYQNVGNYQFKIHPRKDGFATKEFTVITSVTKTQGIHPVIYIWFGFLALFLILLIVKLIRTRL